MHIRNIKLLSLSLLLLSSTVALADKPVWAGNGGKPSKYEKREHKEAMTSKHKYKKNKHKKRKGRDSDYDKVVVPVPSLIKDIEKQRHKDKVKIVKKIHEKHVDFAKKLLHLD